jgi:hypothetical protein
MYRVHQRLGSCYDSQSVRLAWARQPINTCCVAYLPVLSAAVNASSYLHALSPGRLQNVAAAGVAGGL